MQDGRFDQVSGEKIGEFHDRVRKMRRFLEKPLLGCLAWGEDCSRKPIRSHLLSESWLRRLTDNEGHVLQFVLAVEDAGKRPVGVRTALVGVGEATTFPGFCQEHDHALFACIEREPFLASPRQIACLVYRSVCQEISIKHQMLKCHWPVALGPNSPACFVDFTMDQYRSLLELMNLKLRIGEMLSLDKYTIETCLVEFDKTLSVLVATTFRPNVTFTGRRLEQRMDWVTLTILPSSRGGFAVFTWDQASPKNGSLLIKSLKALPNHLVASGILHLALEMSENIVISPKWWESLPKPEQERMLQRFGRGLLPGLPPLFDIICRSPEPKLDWKPFRMSFGKRGRS